MGGEDRASKVVIEKISIPTKGECSLIHPSPIPVSNLFTWVLTLCDSYFGAIEKKMHAKQLEVPSAHKNLMNTIKGMQ